MPDASSSGLLCPAHIAMIDKGVSAIVASSNAAGQPSLMRAMGAAITPDGTRITVFLARAQSRQLLQDLAATGRVAVVFSEPHSHRTVQVKSARTQQRAAVPEDQPCLARYLRAMAHEIGRVGFDAELVRAMLAYRLDDLVAVSFTPDEAFDQTPGPKAGQRLAGAAAH